MTDPNDAVNPTPTPTPAPAQAQAAVQPQATEPEPWDVPGKTFDQVVREVYEGKWGREPELRERLGEYGLDQYQVREAAIRLQVENP